MGTLDSAQNIIVAETPRAVPSGFIDFLTLKYRGQVPLAPGDLDDDG